VSRRAICARLDLPGLLAQMAARSCNGESLVVKKTLDLENQINVFLAIEAMAAVALHRLEHGELRFPIAQHEGFQLGHAADFADAVKVFGNRRLCSWSLAGHNFRRCLSPGTPLS